MPGQVIWITGFSGLIGQGVKVRGVRMEEVWGEVDNPTDLGVYEDMIRRGEIVIG
jgi:hypothetical protein